MPTDELDVEEGRLDISDMLVDVDKKPGYRRWLRGIASVLFLVLFFHFLFFRLISSAKPEPARAPSNEVGVVVFCYNRPEYLSRTLSTIFSALSGRPDRASFSVTVSQDGHGEAVTDLLNATKGINIIQHEQSTASSPYAKLSRHYIDTLTRMFNQYDEVIVLEDDMDISPDFFDYFRTMQPILRNDTSLLCISAFNSAGMKGLVSDNKALLRTDVFPGLGWMMTRAVFDGLKDNWPAIYWDEYFRYEARKGRTCIIPEVSRSRTFGIKGSSGAQFFKSHLSRIDFNQEKVDWGNVTLDRVRTNADYEKFLQAQCSNATVVELGDLDRIGTGKALRVIYNAETYKIIAAKFGLFEDTKGVPSGVFGLPRGSFRGVIPIQWKGNHICLTRNWP